MKETHQLVSVGISTGAAVTVTATARLLVNLSVQHLLAAARFSRNVARVEAEHRGEKFGEFWEEIFHSSTACIMTSAASLEAYANELFFQRERVFPGYSLDLLDKIWEVFESKPTLEKFAFALLLRSKPQMNRGARPFQDVAALIDLRNALVHFKPEWTEEAKSHEQVSRRLERCFAPSAFLNDPLIFPRRWATHGCTEWAVESCLAFANEFEKAAELDQKVQRRSARAVTRLSRKVAGIRVSHPIDRSAERWCA